MHVENYVESMLKISLCVEILSHGEIYVNYVEIQVVTVLNYSKKMLHSIF